MRKDRVIRFVRGLLSEIGENPNREGLRKTPQHVAELYSEIFSGYDATAELEVNFAGGSKFVAVTSQRRPSKQPE